MRGFPGTGEAVRFRTWGMDWTEVDRWRQTEGARQNTAFVAWRCFAELRARPLTDGSPDPLRDRRLYVRGRELMAVRRGHLDGRRRRRWHLKGEKAQLSYLDEHQNDRWEGVGIGRLLVTLDEWHTRYPRALWGGHSKPLPLVWEAAP